MLSWHTLEHVPAQETQARRDGGVTHRRVGGRGGHGLGPIEHDAGHLRVALEYADDEMPHAPADVDELADAGEIVALEHALVGDGAVHAQRLAELFERLRMRGQVLEEIHAGGTTIVMVTHDPELAGRAERNIHLMDGCVLESELPDMQEELSKVQRLNGIEPLSAQL